MSALRQWLRKQDIFDVDLEQVLEDLGIEDPLQDFAVVTEEEFADVRRQMQVMRADDLKDAKARARLEKKLAKLEKFWRAEAGLTHKSSAKKRSKSLAPSKRGQGHERSRTDFHRRTPSKKIVRPPPAELEVDDEVILAGPGDREGVIRWIGELEEFVEGTFYGIELTEGNLGKHDGEINGVRYFQTEPQRAVVVTRERIRKKMTARDKRSSQRLKRRASLEQRGELAPIDLESTAGDDEKGQVPWSPASNYTQDGGGGNLRKWMQSHQVWETGLYEVLQEIGVETVDDVRYMTVSLFDDVVRQTKTMRLTQMKSQRSHQRLEKLLKKFERLWRELADIPDRMDNALTANKSSRVRHRKRAQTIDPAAMSAEPPPSAQGGSAYELKKWMKKQGMFNVDLYEILVEHGVDCPDDLQYLAEPEFDDIKRQTIVARQEATKSASSKRALEKLLATFERHWRDISGVQHGGVRRYTTS